MLRYLPLLSALVVGSAAVSCSAESVLIEAESFESHGGWKLDTQFIHEMGSPYLLAHGLGRPVGDAETTVEVPATGTYHVWVRTKDWVARWGAEGTPGRFQLIIEGEPLETTFGTEGAEWHWQNGGTVELNAGTVQLGLHDLTGFDGRCDAIYLTTSTDEPPAADAVLGDWRREQLGIIEKVRQQGPYDLVVVGGGYAGMGAAISGARMGCRVALIQNRGVLGGNGSSEVRVWAMGNIRRGRFPRIGEIVEEFCDHATKSPGTFEEFEDAKKETIVRAEPNIELFLNHHVYAVRAEEGRVQSVTALDTRTSQVTEFTGRLFSDCTGHGTVGFLANADTEMEPKGRMGMSNMWAWDELEEPAEFPETPWALDLMMDDFPYPRDHHGQWFWESGFDKDPLGDAEGIRDHNLRAVFGAFNAMKNRDGADEHRNAVLTWVAFIGGPRESRRLMGDVVLTQEDIVSKRDFNDGFVPSTWSIDLHYPKEQYADKFPENPFISIAVHDRRVDRQYGYPVPYRCFYSRNIDNLFMAGRNISVTHEALGTTRVMKTCGMMGEVVGRAASLCVRHDCLPRDVYYRHLDELISLIELPGKARRETVNDEIIIPDDAMEKAGPYGPMPGINPESLAGLVIDDRDAKTTGKWTEGTGLKGFVAWGYRYSGGADASVTFEFEAPGDGEHDIRLLWVPHENRGRSVPVTVTTGGNATELVVNMSEPAGPENLRTLGTFRLSKGTACSVRLSAAGAGGLVHADAVQVIPVK